MKRILRAVACFLAVLTVVISSLCAFAARWALTKWANLQMDELIYTLSTLEGTSSDMIIECAVNCALPAAVCLALMVILTVLVARRRPRSRTPFLLGCLTGAAITLAVTGVVFWNELEIGDYISSMSQRSEYIQDNYVDPDDVKLEFPEEKRNLVYIFMESTEITFADVESGGGFEENLIPELTQLAIDGEDFSGDTTELNGAYAATGATWTVAAMFAQTSGLPLKISIGDNSMNQQDSFFGGITSLGDILEDAGYKQTLLIGSDAVFGGRALYFSEHGNYELKDYKYAVTEGLISPDYYVWWGYEDEKLFDNARAELTALAAGDEPFNLTLLTVDTHFEDGYVCALCGDSHGENQYANVYTCASCQVNAFVEWIQQQDFYENTTIVICGDHLTMDSDFCDDVAGNYERRVYTTIINSAVEYTGSARREYSTFDMFPTTLAALGVKIPGNRLGLGTNLYSAASTLVERDGLSFMNAELKKRSLFMEALADIQTYADATLDVSYLEKMDRIYVKVYDIFGIGENIDYVQIEVDDESGRTRTARLTLGRDGSYVGVMDIDSGGTGYGSIIVDAYGESGKKYRLGSAEGDFRLCQIADLNSYLEVLALLEDHTIFIAIADEGTNALTDENMELLRALGVETELIGAYRNSYYAVITPDGVTEEISDTTMLSCKGELADGKSYKVASTSYTARIVNSVYSLESTCSVIIDGREYGAGGRGLNFVVYDNVQHRVVDSSVYDTYGGIATGDMSITPLDDGELEIVVNSLTGDEAFTGLLIRYWDANNQSSVHQQKVSPESDGTYAVTLDIGDLDTDSAYVIVYAVNLEGDRIRLTEINTAGMWD